MDKARATRMVLDNFSSASLGQVDAPIHSWLSARISIIPEKSFYYEATQSLVNVFGRLGRRDGIQEHFYYDIVDQRFIVWSTFTLKINFRI